MDTLQKGINSFPSPKVVKQFNDDILVYLFFFNCLLINFLFSNILTTASETNTKVAGN